MKKRFDELAKRWKADVRFEAHPSKRAQHEAYREIVNMGEDVVPFLLDELRSPPLHDWFWALAEITEENPVPKDERGRFEKMAQRWLEWGERNGYA